MTSTKRPLWRAPALWCWLALVLLAAWMCVRATYVADMSAFLPAAPTPEQRVLFTQLKNGTTARVLMIGIRGGQPQERADASRRLARGLRDSGAFEAVHNGDNQGAEGVGRLLFERRYLLSPAVDAQRFTVDGLRDGISDTVSLLGTPAGARLKSIIWRDPTGETVRMAESMMPVTAPRVEDDVWVSRTEPRAILVATTRADGGDLDGQAHAQNIVRERFAALAMPGLTLELSGAGVFAVDSRTTIKAEVEKLAMADTVAMVVLLLIAFGSFKPLGAAVLPVVSGVLAGVAVVSLLVGQVHGLTLGFGTTLIGEAIDYGIYYLVQARGMGSERWRQEYWPAVRLGLLTSLAGFAALAFSGFSGLAQLGIFAISGLIAAALTTRYVLPLLAPQGARGSGMRLWLGQATAQGAAVLPKFRGALLLLTLAAGALLVWHESPWKGTLSTLSSVKPEAMALNESLQADLGAADVGTLVAIEAPDEASALEGAERAGVLLNELVQRGRLQGYGSPAAILPSPATQLARRAALPEPQVLRERLAMAAAGGPLPASKLEGFIADVAAQRNAPVLTRADLQGSPLASGLEAQLTPGDGKAPWMALLTLQSAPGTHLEASELRELLRPLPNARVVQIQPELYSIYDHYLKQARWQALVGALAVALLLAWSLRSPSRLLRVLLPLAASVVLVLAGLTLAGVPLGVLHLVGFLLVVAIGSNYALFFDHLQATGAADSDTLASLFIANLTTVISFAVLAAADVPVLAALGQTVAPGALLALLLSAAFIVRPGASTLTPVNLMGESPDRA